MLKSFDDHDFKPNVIIFSFLVYLGVKTISIEVEVVNTPFYYNIILGCSWIYAMMAVVSLVFFEVISRFQIIPSPFLFFQIRFSLSFPPSTLTHFSLFCFPSYYSFLVLTLSHILDHGFPGLRTYNFSSPPTTSHHESDRPPCCSILIRFYDRGLLS
jgi:hypothetical protein